MIWEHFNLLLLIMSALAVVVFVCLFFVDAGYGKFYTRKWGPAISNRTGWVLMESPVFIAMLVLCLCSERREDPIRLLFLIIFGGLSIWAYIILWIIIPEQPAPKFNINRKNR